MLWCCEDVDALVLVESAAVPTDGTCSHWSVRSTSGSICSLPQLRFMCLRARTVEGHAERFGQLEVEQDRVTAMVPTPVPTLVHVSPVPAPQQSDAERAGCEDAAISDLDLAFGNDSGPNKKPKVEHPPLQRIPLAPPNPRDVESVVNGGNYDVDDLRELRDLLEEKVITQAASRQSTPVSG